MTATRSVRIAGGQGFWGDWLEAPWRQVTGGPVDYLMMDYLAEVTMSIMQKQKSRDGSLGYAKDFVPLMERLLPELVKRKVRVTTNAGGVNPRACAAAVAEVARRLGLAVVEGYFREAKARKVQPAPAMTRRMAETLQQRVETSRRGSPADALVEALIIDRIAESAPLPEGIRPLAAERQGWEPRGLEQRRHDNEQNGQEADALGQGPTSAPGRPVWPNLIDKRLVPEGASP